MKLYALYTPSHEVLAKEWFLPSLRDDYDLHVEPQAQCGAEAEHRYGTAAFNRTTLAKVDLILQAIEDTWNDIFAFSDVDIQFFQPSRKALLASIRGRDIAFQQNQINGEINTGFFVCRGNERARCLWTGVKDLMKHHPEWNDQDALNHALFRPSPFHNSRSASPPGHAAEACGHRNPWHRYASNRLHPACIFQRVQRSMALPAD